MVDGVRVKAYRGMGSPEAMIKGSEVPFHSNTCNSSIMQTLGTFTLISDMVLWQANKLRWTAYGWRHTGMSLEAMIKGENCMLPFSVPSV